MNHGWYGVDLDGTLAEHYWPEKGPYEHTRIGDPIPAMVERVRAWIAEGRDVRIFTARVAEHYLQPGGTADAYALDARHAISKWCAEHLGAILQVTAVKDYGMVELWDDRAVRVIADTGKRCCGNEADAA